MPLLLLPAFAQVQSTATDPELLTAAVPPLPPLPWPLLFALPPYDIACRPANPAWPESVALIAPLLVMTAPADDPPEVLALPPPPWSASQMPEPPTVCTPGNAIVMLPVLLMVYIWVVDPPPSP
ncbi:hypothetical protein BOFL111202_26240 [Bordetella flabilis]